MILKRKVSIELNGIAICKCDANGYKTCVPWNEDSAEPVISG